MKRSNHTDDAGQDISRRNRVARKVIGLASLAVVMLAGWNVGLAQAQVPQYYVVRAPAEPLHQGGHGYQPAQVQPVSRPAYAYGWFGATPRSHWSRHFGYYRNYTQWSKR